MLPTTPADEELPRRLTAAHIRVARFPVAWRGCDPAAVHAYLGLVADEILRLQRLAAAYADGDRIKRTPRQWQSDHAATCRGSMPRPISSRDWPINRP